MHAAIAQTVLHAPNRKPLYLLATRGSRVDAGPDHLILRRDGAPPLRFPLARIARIICNTHTHWSGTAIALCMEHGLSITWINGHGHALGHTNPLRAQAPDLANLLDTYLELKSWHPRFENWVVHRRLHILQDWAQSALDRQHPADQERYAALKRSFVQNGQIPLQFAPEGQGYCHALVAEHLGRQQLDTVYWGFDGQPLALAEHLGLLLWAMLNLNCGNLAAQTSPGQLPAHLFEARAHDLTLQLQTLLGSLTCHIAREINTWQ